MARKYIKGKDGKFAGSVPSTGSAPSGVPTIPSKTPDLITPDASSENYRQLALQYAAKQKVNAEFPIVDERYEENGEVYLGSSISTELEGKLTYDDGAYIATVVSNFDEGSEYIDEAFFTDSSEAETWLKEEITTRLTPIKEFAEGWENNRVAFLHDLEAECVEKDVWEDVIVSGGYPTAKLMNANSDMSAKISYYDDEQYSVVIKKYSELGDADGEEYLVHSVSTFEEGLNFARYFMARG